MNDPRNRPTAIQSCEDCSTEFHGFVMSSPMCDECQEKRNADPNWQRFYADEEADKWVEVRS